MISYKHRQIGYFLITLIVFATLIVLAVFAWLQITARAEPVSVDSGANFAITAIMVLIIFTLLALTLLGALTVVVDEQFLRIRFGLGIFRKKFPLAEIASIKKVKNPWYYGWGIRLWLSPKMWIFNVSGFDAVELIMKDGNIYRIGTDEPDALREALSKYIC